mgnify:FL=1
MSNSTPHKGLKRQVGLSLFSAIIVVLTVLGNFVRFGPVPITLSLAPIIIGAAVYGNSAGALLGGVFGLVVLLGGIFGWDGGTVMLLMGLNPIGCILICIGKGILAGYLSGLAYRAIENKSPLAAVVTAGVVCPVVNTGLFIIGMLVFYGSTLQSWAGGQNVIYYAIFGLAGINFVVELLVNLVLSSGITTVIKYAASRR